ncbi:7-cyano-7-deazaguanine/7-aminomethyl-7-deazaguanine transporter [Legionella jordanis]|uniref:Probable queuosine precursor transporter n=1 Tax=Legionella jordanis TaxID=456 RepID=A0A0W0VCI8_9GAMM|nr:7-cyano-7-deazaguanine/7-aminomethyl-7-deazaguanine transporter [Legionella jordanis]KTD17844.1 membrane protein [Legionella jordanis]RMX02456.1 7-cyano-7-deazaguanine/7-aminomethyl-7-deazaguanine transporter [Legionella jordanis]RMX21701.1 7-cyano-7-deazaguanine/7-aminomethyl-7-deazaguanine transporter [Legionella jordanis]VEH11219.1 membrane protein [Legionella jordanis]HAT8713813.1 7-cyano-7-deazaguanine/7-aminomethyl-7-deazaguanine transporter [Legionella jordanis]
MLVRQTLFFLALAHIFIVAISNTLVQHPVTLMHWHTTWGAFSYPLIFILTDLTTRLLGQNMARKVIFLSMFPALVISYVISNYYSQNALFPLDSLSLRIALASFCAYVVGQVLDISIFQTLRRQQNWWLAPSVANLFGNIFDTYCFFFIAFFECSNAFLASHWLEIATVDLLFKLVISFLSFIPLYGIILNLLLRSRVSRAAYAETAL